MASTTTKQTPASFVGTSKVVETDYPVCLAHNWQRNGEPMTDWDLAHRQRPVRFPLGFPGFMSSRTVVCGVQGELTNADGFLGSHFKRVIGYARTSDYVAGATSAAFAPAALYALERLAPSHVGRGGFAKAMRLAGFIGLAGGFLYFYQRSARTSLFARPLIF